MDTTAVSTGATLRGARGRRIGTVDAVFADYLLVRTAGLLPVDLYVPRPGADGRVQVDFNRAYNPPCAFTAFATCPLPPPENRLDLAITAGEKAYGGPH